LVYLWWGARLAKGQAESVIEGEATWHVRAKFHAARCVAELSTSARLTPDVSICTHKPEQIRDLQDHLDAAVALDAAVIADLRALAVQLDGQSVLPLIGAGGSFDCGMPLAASIGRDLLDDYRANPDYAPHQAGLAPLMGDVTEAIYVSANQDAVVKALGLPEPALWPAAAEVHDHFCGYRVLARLAREQLFAQAATFNYDCAYEAGLLDEGFTLAPGATPGARFPDHVTLIADARAANDTTRPGSLVLRKLHGCAASYRRDVADPAVAQPEDRIIVRTAQLTHWRDDIWARDYLRQYARTDVLLLIGFSGQDHVIAGEILSLLTEIHRQAPRPGEARVIAIDYDPNTIRLNGLIHAGLGETQPAPGVITKICTDPAGNTATLIALLTEMLDYHLADALSHIGHALPEDLEQRIAALTIAAPVMLRWSYLLRPSAENDLNQRANLQSVARRGYVPLLLDPLTTASALRTRAVLRAALGQASESTRDALENHAFLTDPAAGFAYMPCGLSFETLRAGARPAGELHTARETLPSPSGLDCVLVSADPVRRGISLTTGDEVPVP
jgi:hypothetical protein